MKMNGDGRSWVCENKATLTEVIVKEVLLANPNKVFTIDEIYEELISKNLYEFSPLAKTPKNSISSRLSTAVKKDFSRLKKVKYGKYFAA
jgi:hypothetical protein